MISLLHLEFVQQPHKLQPQDLVIALLRMMSAGGTILSRGMVWMNWIGRGNLLLMEGGTKHFNLHLWCTVSFRFPINDHTTGNDDGFYMQVSRDSIQRAGDRAFFVSREMEGTSRPRCMSFWYYMYEPIVDTTGPNLGKLAVWTRTIDRWRNQNEFKEYNPVFVEMTCL